MFSSGLYSLKNVATHWWRTTNIGHLSERENRAVSSDQVEELWAASLARRETWEGVQRQNRRPAHCLAVHSLLNRVSSATPVE